MSEPPSDAARALPRRLALFDHGFRPFFWLAGAFALAGVAAWTWMLTGAHAPFGSVPPMLWHGHEMLFGFVGAAIAGFLLTAVPSWTGARGFGGLPLVLLSAQWLAGRMALAALGVLPYEFVALCELFFLPGLAVFVAPPLIRSRNRNTPLLFVLLAIWLADLYFLLSLRAGDLVAARHALLLALDVILLLMTVIAGRIVPAFTASGLRQHGIAAEVRGRPLLDNAAIAVMIAVVGVDLFAPWQPVAGWAAAIAAPLHAARLAGWRGHRALRVPLVWCLHLAYAWLALGFGLKAAHLLAGGAWSARWLHALTIGAAAAMILAVMSRAALGHTGRPLIAARPTGAAYLLLTAAAFTRVLAPAVPGASDLWTVVVAALLWLGAFALFLIVYSPILFRPRPDNRPG